MEAELGAAGQGLQGGRRLEGRTEVQDELKVQEPPAAKAGDGVWNTRGGGSSVVSR